jgi:hypothetical protein
MSYALSAALQDAVYQQLLGDAPLAAQVGGAIYDAAPSGALPSTYVVLGPEEVRDRSGADYTAAIHDFTVSVVTSSAGFQIVKSVASAISDALQDAPLSLSRGRLVSLRFQRASAQRISRGAQRKIDLRFRAMVEDT